MQWHGVVDASSSKYNSWVITELLRFKSEVIWIYWQAVTANACARIIPHEVPLGCGGRYYLKDIHTQALENRASSFIKAMFKSL
jgi:hypothetical protein